LRRLILLTWKHLRGLVLFGAGLVILLLFCVFMGMKEQRAFDRMTPTEHITAARRALAFHVGSPAALGADEMWFSEVSRQLENYRQWGAQAEEAEEILREVAAAKQAAVAAREAADEQARQRALLTAIRDLVTGLKDLGYDVNAAPFTWPGPMVLVSDDFADTTRRVEFLSLLRSRREGVCRAGMRAVHLATPMAYGFNGDYPLGCLPLNPFRHVP
jgi:hypothetical protein